MKRKVMRNLKAMKQQQIFLVYLVCAILVSCASDGVEYEKDYTHSDNVIDRPDTTDNNLQQAQYHFELGLKMALLDKDTVGDSEGAIKELDKAIGLNPDFQRAYHYRSIIYSYLGQDVQAMRDIQRALELDVKAVESYFVRAGLFANQGNYANTIKDLDIIIRLEPNNGKAYDHRGYAKIELGDKNEGCNDLNKARELGYMVGNKEGDKLICK